MPLWLAGAVHCVVKLQNCIRKSTLYFYRVLFGVSFISLKIKMGPSCYWLLQCITLSCDMGRHL
nr:MAG TPA: hypothetical protein [Caudoviricetes sp.]